MPIVVETVLPSYSSRYWRFNILLCCAVSDAPVTAIICLDESGTFYAPSRPGSCSFAAG